ncbi:MAG: ATP-binding protein [Clostridia bacterium]|nr:ATP-binding protein [Clostridia bacterium]
MLFRKIESYIRDFLKSHSNKVLVIDGARQIGKSFIIRKVGTELFENYIELNFVLDRQGPRIFENVNSVEDFYFALSTICGDKMKDKENTIVFFDEIQVYPQFITLLKFLKQDDRYTYVASGSLLGVTLADTSSIPIGSIELTRMYQLDFEEFLIANGTSSEAIRILEGKFLNRESLDEAMHQKLLDLFKKYLIVGGLPDCVNEYLSTRNVMNIRKIQEDIIRFYGEDASKYDTERKLKIKRIYDMLPSTMQNTKKRIVVKDIEGIKGKRYSNYTDEFDYLISSGIALDVKAISNPVFPLCQSEDKNLLKLYMNDVGLLSGLLYRNNVKPILEDVRTINLGALYETAVAGQLKALGHRLFYYDNRRLGEVDFLIDDYDTLSVLPIEVKSGRDYTVHSALNQFISNDSYPVKEGIVLSNEREIKCVGKITYLPIYFVMFLRPQSTADNYLL